MKLKLFAIGALLSAAFLLGYGDPTSVVAYPGGGIWGRGEHRGYFTNTLDDDGTYVLPQDYDGNAIPASVNNIDEFIGFIKYTKLDIDNNGSGNAQEKTGAAFIIHTMLGSGIGSRNRPPTSAQIAEWEQRVRYWDALGKVDWHENYSYTINSFYQGSSPNDDAFYDENATADSITFRDQNNNVVYAIKRFCANPVGRGSLGPIPDKTDFNMWGTSSVSAPTVTPGSQVTFRHNLQNIGVTGTSPFTINWRAYNPNGGGVVASGNAGTFSAGQLKSNVSVENYQVPANAVPGSQICRYIWYQPDTEYLGTQSGNQVCTTVSYNFTLNPIVNILVNGSAATTVAQPGDTVTFRFLVSNNGSTVSQNNINCTIYGTTRTGYYTEQPGGTVGSNGGYSPPATGCPRSFPAFSTTTLTTEVVAAASVNQNNTLCRSLFINPTTQNGGSAGTEACIQVVAKPYFKAYGGDVAAGSGLETLPGSCTPKPTAGILAWNNTGDYSGAGAQYAALAMYRIYDFASSQNAGISTTEPSGLTFANTSAVIDTANRLYGGSFGSAPCIKNHYAKKPATATTVSGSVNISPLGTGSYAAGAGITIPGGIVNPGQKITLYVDGDVYITGNITYAGNWAYNNIPMFKLVARGNIYINRSVTQLDGTYVAQANAGVGGTIYTCATSAAPLSLSIPNLYTTCNNKLTVNGAFVAANVDLLRTAGTLSRAPTDELSSSPNIGETFNYGPAFWIPQPDDGSDTVKTYDAITSLPPVL